MTYTGYRTRERYVPYFEYIRVLCCFGHRCCCCTALIFGWRNKSREDERGAPVYNPRVVRENHHPNTHECQNPGVSATAPPFRTKNKHTSTHTQYTGYTRARTRKTHAPSAGVRTPLITPQRRTTAADNNSSSSSQQQQQHGEHREHRERREHRNSGEQNQRLASGIVSDLSWYQK